MDESTLRLEFKKLFQRSKIDGDKSILIEGKELRFHSLIVFPRSAFIKGLFSFNEKKDGSVNLENVHSWEVYSLLLEYLYTDQLDEDLDPSLSVELFLLAREHVAPILKFKCAKRVVGNGRLTMDTALDILDLFSDYSCEKLQEDCVRFIQLNFTRVITKENIEKYEALNERLKESIWLGIDKENRTDYSDYISNLKKST
eukprot:TRINITY_DN3767_c0_g1_i1.p1 TRINITY_DN3767_c0_g1~~TRINITY_DN3767_c0_g1_i1.p1  ORF type:complete len:210 (+),score=19.33 TRINITY_DN3767_c0_g1_i1:32-631(+)